MWPSRDRGPGLDPDRTQMETLDLSLDHHKSTLQDLNYRLSSYIHQVRRLEAANQTLEQQIEAELQRKSPLELKHLDSHLKSASHLQEQIEDEAWEVAVLKLQFLGAELSVFDLRSRCEQEGAERLRVEAALGDLRRRGAGLEEEGSRLNQEANEKEEELRRVKLQHQQVIRGLQGLGAGVSVEVRSGTRDPGLAQQLQSASWSGITLPPLLDWSHRAPQVEACVSVEEAERLELTSAAAELQRVLDQLCSENSRLESDAVEHMEAVEERLQTFGAEAAQLCDDLQNVLDASENQSQLTSALHQDITELREELQRYQGLLQASERTQNYPREERGAHHGLLQASGRRGEQRVSRSSSVPRSFKATSVHPLSPTKALRPGQMQAGQMRAGQSVQRQSGFSSNLPQDVRRESSFPAANPTADAKASAARGRSEVGVNKSSVLKVESKTVRSEAAKASNGQLQKAKVGASVTKVESFDKTQAARGVAQGSSVEASRKINGEIDKPSTPKAEPKIAAKESKKELQNAKVDANVPRVSSTGKVKEVKTITQVETSRKINGEVDKPSILKQESKIVSSEAAKDGTKELQNAKVDANVTRVSSTSKVQEVKTTTQVETTRKISVDVDKPSILKQESKIVSSEAAKESKKELQNAKVEANVPRVSSTELGSSTKDTSLNSQVETTTKINVEVDKPTTLKAESKTAAKEDKKELQSAKVDANGPRPGSASKVQEVKTTTQVETTRKISLDVDKPSVLKVESKIVSPEAAKDGTKELQNAKVDANVTRVSSTSKVQEVKTTTQVETTRKISVDVDKPSSLKAESKIVSSEAAKEGKKELQNAKVEANVPRVSSTELGSSTKAISQNSQVETTTKISVEVDKPTTLKAESKIAAKEDKKELQNAKVDANVTRPGSASKVQEVKTTTQVETSRKISVEVDKPSVLKVESKIVSPEVTKEDKKELQNAKVDTNVPRVGSTSKVQEVKTTTQVETTRKLSVEVDKPSVLKVESKITSSEAAKKSNEPLQKANVEAIVTKVSSTPSVSSQTQEARIIQGLEKPSILKVEPKTVSSEAARVSSTELGRTTKNISLNSQVETTTKISADVGKPSVLKVESETVSAGAGKESNKNLQDAKVEASVPRSAAQAETKSVSKIIRSEEDLATKEPQKPKVVAKEAREEKKMTNVEQDAKLKTETIGKAKIVDAKNVPSGKSVSSITEVVESRNAIDSGETSAGIAKLEAPLAVDAQQSQSEKVTVKTKPEIQAKITDEEDATVERNRSVMGENDLSLANAKTEAQPTPSTAQPQPKRTEKIVIVKIIEETQDSVSNTSTEPQDQVVWSSEFSVQKASGNQDSAAGDVTLYGQGLDAENSSTSRPKSTDADSKTGNHFVFVKVTEEVQESVSKTNVEAKTVSKSRPKEQDVEDLQGISPKSVIAETEIAAPVIKESVGKISDEANKDFTTEEKETETDVAQLGGKVLDNRKDTTDEQDLKAKVQNIQTEIGSKISPEQTSVESKENGEMKDYSSKTQADLSAKQDAKTDGGSTLSGTDLQARVQSFEVENLPESSTKATPAESKIIVTENSLVDLKLAKESPTIAQNKAEEEVGVGSLGKEKLYQETINVEAKIAPDIKRSQPKSDDNLPRKVLESENASDSVVNCAEISKPEAPLATQKHEAVSEQAADKVLANGDKILMQSKSEILEKMTGKDATDEQHLKTKAENFQDEVKEGSKADPNATKDAKTDGGLTLSGQDLQTKVQSFENKNLPESSTKANSAELKISGTENSLEDSKVAKEIPTIAQNKDANQEVMVGSLAQELGAKEKEKKLEIGIGSEMSTENNNVVSGKIYPETIHVELKIAPEVEQSQAERKESLLSKDLESANLSESAVNCAEISKPEAPLATEKHMAASEQAADKVLANADTILKKDATDEQDLETKVESFQAEVKEGSKADLSATKDVKFDESLTLPGQDLQTKVQSFEIKHLPESSTKANSGADGAKEEQKKLEFGIGSEMATQNVSGKIDTEIINVEVKIAPEFDQSQTKGDDQLLSKVVKSANVSKSVVNCAEISKPEAPLVIEKHEAASEQAADKLLTNGNKILTQNKSEILEKMTGKDAITAAPTKTSKEEVEISQDFRSAKEDKTEIPLKEVEKVEIGVKIPNEKSIIRPALSDSAVMSLRFANPGLAFDQNAEFQQDMENEELFMRLGEDAFCPQDLEEFGEMEMEASADADFDEDLTEANVRVRPVERYLLKESPPQCDNLADFEETKEMGDGFGDEMEVPICTSVTGSLQIVGAERVIAEKEKDVGFGGLYRAKESGKSPEGFRESRGIDEQVGKDKMHEGISSRSSEDREGLVVGEGKRNVEQTEERFGKSDVDSWISGRVEKDKPQKDNEVDETMRQGRSDAEKVPENVPKAEQVVEVGDQKSEAPLDGDLRKTGDEKVAGAVDVPKSEGSLDIPFSPPGSGQEGSEWRVYGRSSGRMSTSPPSNISPKHQLSPLHRGAKAGTALASSPPEMGRIGALYGGRSENTRFDFSPQGLSRTGGATSPVARPMSPTDGQGRFGKAGSGEWRVYGQNRDRLSQSAAELQDLRLRALSPTARPTSPVPMPMSPTEMGRFGKAGSGEWRVYGQNRDRLSQSAAELQDLRSRALSPTARPTSPVPRPMSPTEMGRFRKAGSGEWLVYGQHNRDRMSWPEHADSQFDFRPMSPEEMVNSGMFFADFGPESPPTELGTFNLTPRPLSPPPAGPYGRFGKADSGEWLVYGNSSTTGRASKSASDERLTVFRSRTLSPQRPLSPGAGGEWMVYRSLSPTRADVAGGHFDSRKRTLSPPNVGGRLAALGKKEWLVYKSGKDGDKLRKRALSPPEVQRKQFFVRGADGKKSGRNIISSLGKLVKSVKGKDRGGKELGGKEGGRVISSSDGPIRSSDSGTGAKKERLSVCKMAAMTMSKERSGEKKKKAETAPPSSVQHWLSTSDPRPEKP